LSLENRDKAVESVKNIINHCINEQCKYNNPRSMQEGLQCMAEKIDDYYRRGDLPSRENCLGGDL